MRTKYNGKLVEVLDRLVSPTTNRQIVIIRDGLSTFPVDANDFDSPDVVKVPAMWNKEGGTQFSVTFEGDRADVVFKKDGRTETAYGFIRTDDDDGTLQAVSYAIQIIRDRITQKQYGGWNNA